MIRKLENRPDVSFIPKPPYQRPHDGWTEVAPIALPPGDVGEGNGLTSNSESRLGERSLRSKRAVFVGSVTAFFLGALLIVLSSPYRFEVLAPGKLASPHSQILAAEGSDRCAACHEAANDSFGSWVSAALFGRDANRPTQSQLCMNCHEKNIDAGLAMNPHNVDDQTLNHSSQRMRDRDSKGVMSNVGFASPMHQGEIACNACHREHHGDDQNLAAMTDAQCQVCHASQFRAFEIDHPEFQNYGAERRSRIAFDHNSHFYKHFPATSAAFNCQACHLGDDSNNVKTLASFEQSCASCHEEKIKQSASAGLVLLSLPMLDMDAFESRKLSVGSWPLAATGDFDGPLPPTMRMLLAADPKSKPIVDRLPLDFDFSDIDPDDDQAVADSVELVWAIKRLLFELSKHGPAELERRIETSLQIEVTPEQLSAVTPNLDRYGFAQAVRRWLPNLPLELQSSDQALHEMGDDRKLEFSNLRPEKKLRDFEVPSSVSWWPKDEKLLAKMEATLSNHVQDDDVLVANPLKVLMESKGVEPRESSDTAMPPSDGLVESDPGDTKNASDSETFDPPNRTSPVVASAKSTTPVLQYELEVATEGWIRDDTTFKIAYVPSGHADRSLVQWIDWTAASSRAPNDPGSANLFQRLVSNEGLGNCRTCHTAERYSAEGASIDLAMNSKAWSQLISSQAPASRASAFDSTGQLTLQRLDASGSDDDISTGQEKDRLLPPALKVNWKAVYRDPSSHGFTKFSHAPHMIQPGLRDCSHCHQLDREQVNSHLFAGFDPSEFVSNFAPIRIANCSSCHAENRTSNGCTQCHHYHVGLSK